MKNLKSIDKVTVLVAACDLMIANSNTTTLDVKNELRKNGYEARQYEVSAFMRELASEESWDATPNGVFTIYSPGSSAIATSTPSTGSSAPAKVAPVSGTAAVELMTPVTGCWEVNTVDGKGNVEYYAAGATRTAVRWAFSKSTGVNYSDTRSRIRK